jgi:hypothetical protein
VASASSRSGGENREAAKTRSHKISSSNEWLAGIRDVLSCAEMGCGELKDITDYTGC